MKKVLVLVAAVFLFATPAMAGISGSAHDLSGLTGTDQLCVFCHAPHGVVAANGAPLWNRSTYDVGTLSKYVGVDLDTTINALDTADIRLCLDCHDGTVNTALKVAETVQNQAISGYTDFVDGLNDITDTTAALGLSNDHPVGFTYDDTLAGTDGELTLPSSDTWITDGLTTGVMTCATCHDVHNEGTAGADYPFLRTSNAGSAMCLTCHTK